MSAEEEGMKPRKVGSREYKVMLRAARFEPGEFPREGAEAFWKWLAPVAREAGATRRGELNEVDKRREVRFYDTEDCRLRRSGYVLRERRKLEGSSASPVRRVTLKYRHPDRFISQARDMKQKDAARGAPKFEEDIKPLFSKPYLASLYSFSSKIEIEDPLDRLGAAARYFGDLGDRLGEQEGDPPLALVGSFAARETVVVGGDLELGDITAECALIVWHDSSAGETSAPELVEFSFRYEGEKEKFDGRSVETAFRVFRALQTQTAQDEWIPAGSKTKTASVYARAQCGVAAEELD